MIVVFYNFYFVHAQVYVQISRVVDPKNYAAVGLPPEDLLDEVAQAWAAEGWDVDDLFKQAASVTDEWIYEQGKSGADPATRVRSRLRPRYEERRRVPLRLASVAQILNPQPETARVLHGLLEWIARADVAAQSGDPRPDLRRADGQPLFPEDEHWWLTDLERRRKRPDSAALGDLSEARLDEADLTFLPEEAGVESSDGDSADDTGSECSLPAGPSPATRPRKETAPPAEPRPAVPPAAKPVERPTKRLRTKRTPASTTAEAPPVEQRPAASPGGNWEAPRQTLAPLQQFLGAQMAVAPPWYNHSSSEAIDTSRRQQDATCGLHAVNHTLAAAAARGGVAQRVLSRRAFEEQALAAGIADSPANLVTPGHANYDWAVLHHHLGRANLRATPMTPDELQGDTPANCRLQLPFVEHCDAGRRHTAVAYILRTPQSGGHWITLLPPESLGEDSHSGNASILCDSLQPAPFRLSHPETEGLLTVCALQNAAAREQDGNAANSRWACFLVTDEGVPIV